MEPTYVMGIKQLGDDTRKMFYEFFDNFVSRQGTDGQVTLRPISVKATRDKENGEYLRFVYEIHGRRCWLHVINSNTWY
jgi:hypothetical protein